MRPDLLLWLAESHRNFHLAGPGLSESLSRELWTYAPWTQGVACEIFPLRYEPRSLARSPDCTKIVVGTKAGFLQMASWEGNRWNYGLEWQLGSEFGGNGETIPRSIRAVRFLDDSTFVAGWGEGVFGVFDADSLICRHLVRSEQSSQVGEATGREHEWLGRFARFISLVPPTTRPAPDSCSAVMLGVTIGSEVHVLYRDGETYSARSFLPEQILPKWGAGARVVDGVWSHNFLWVLDSSGQVYRYAPIVPQSSRWNIPLRLIETGTTDVREEAGAEQSEGIYPVEHPRATGEFRAIAACVMGLAVLTSDDITFLRFKMPKSGEDLPDIEPSSARWVAVPNAIDCSVCLPFSNGYLDVPLASQPITKKDPVWTVVSMSQSGLRWISWHDPKHKSRGPLPTVSHAHRAGSGDSSVLQVRFGFHDRRGPTFIVCATRDHRLRITTLLDRYPTEELLVKEIPAALASDPLLAQERGIAWWLALQRIRDDFSQFGSDAKDDPRKLLRFTEREDLHRLARLTLTQWSESPLDRKTKRNILRDWICHILARAYQIEQTLAQEIGKLVYDRIAQMSGRREEKGRQVEADLGPFAAFIRKWVVYGHTYGEKTKGLLRLYDWNKRSGHTTDALNYLTKLLRRRVDPLWEALPVAGSTNSTIWDLVAPHSGIFSIHSCTDGNITATDSNGRILTWEADDLSESLKREHYIEIWQGQLRHSLAEKFLDKYRHGPYSRSLLLSQIASHESSAYLLVFCLRGWRPEDHVETESEFERNARLYALLVAPSAEGMRILAIDSQVLPAELYGFCEVEDLTERGTRHVLVAGTKGAWRYREGWTVRPFIEFTIEIGGNRQVSIDLEQKTNIWFDRRGERSIFNKEDLLPETAHNPCWSICSFKSPSGKLWLWTGFHDGHIRCFLRDYDLEGCLSWIEGGGLEKASFGRQARFTHQESGLTTSAPVWHLHVLREQQLLAYGTAGGVIGVVSLAEGKGNSEEQRPRLAHHRESSPICALFSYAEPENGSHLLAMTQDGVVVLFDLEFQNRKTSNSSSIRFPGLSLDRFALGHGARAAAVVQYDNAPHNLLLGGPLPALLVGSDDGSVFKHALAMPRGTERRQTAFHGWCGELLVHREVVSVDGALPPPPMSLFIGDNEYAWLRVLDVRGVHLLRFSISWELRQRWPLEKITTLVEGHCLQAYLAHLNILADDIYGRRPLTPEPAKVIWEEAARVANQIAAMALHEENEEKQEALLTTFLELNKLVDDLCNRWIGSEQAVESRVLMHTFNCLFAWAGIILIGLAHPTQRVVSVRRFLLHNIIQRRLSFNDYIVPLETLRNLNIAMMASVCKVSTAGGRQWSLALRPQLGVAGRTGLYDLLTTVGDLGERHAGSLTPSNPLWTELSRFFAATLLLLPKGSFVISQVVAESRLTERDTRFAHAVQAQAEVMLSQLAMEHSGEVEIALGEFKDSFDDKIDDEISRPRGERESGKPVAPSAWQRLLKKAEEVEGNVPIDGYEELSNEAFLLDHASAIRTAAHFIWLNKQAILPEREREWLNGHSPYFEHSRNYLRRMEQRWGQVCQAGNADSGVMSNDSALSSITRALLLCDEEITFLKDEADLFEPQRTQYIKVIGKWREQIWKRAEDAVGLLDILDKFNRHTYRASSDQLMSSITELAFQVAPLWLDLDGTKPLQSEIERRLVAHPLVKTIFDSGNRLVASTHLVGTLFAVARDYYLNLTSSALAPYQTTLKDIQGEVEKFCRFEGLACIGTLSEEISVPGTLAVWDTIVQEVVTNTRKYCGNDRTLVVSREAIEGRVRISFAGRRPFIECLHGEYLAQLGEELPAIDRLCRLLDFVKLTKQAGSRLAPLDTAEEGSSGMGLPFILQICRYLGMQADVVLRGPDIATRRSEVEVPVDAKLRWPLCLEIEWEEVS